MKHKAGPLGDICASPELVVHSRDERQLRDGIQEHLGQNLTRLHVCALSVLGSVMLKWLTQFLKISRAVIVQG